MSSWDETFSSPSHSGGTNFSGRFLQNSVFWHLWALGTSSKYHLYQNRVEQLLLVSTSANFFITDIFKYEQNSRPLKAKNVILENFDKTWIPVTCPKMRISQFPLSGGLGGPRPPRANFLRIFRSRLIFLTFSSPYWPFFKLWTHVARERMFRFWKKFRYGISGASTFSPEKISKIFFPNFFDAFSGRPRPSCRLGRLQKKFLEGMNPPGPATKVSANFNTPKTGRLRLKIGPILGL